MLNALVYLSMFLIDSKHNAGNWYDSLEQKLFVHCMLIALWISWTHEIADTINRSKIYGWIHRFDVQIVSDVEQFVDIVCYLLLIWYAFVQNETKSYFRYLVTFDLSNACCEFLFCVVQTMHTMDAYIFLVHSSRIVLFIVQKRCMDQTKIPSDCGMLEVENKNVELSQWDEIPGILRERLF